MRNDNPAASGANFDRTDLDWPHHVGAVDRVLEAVDFKVRQRRRRTRRRCLAAGAVVAVVLGGLAWRTAIPWQPGSSRGLAAVPSAVVAAPVRHVLADGSIVELNEDGRIAVEFTAEMRRVVLQEGEAHFQVTKNPARPFVVRAGGVDVRAVGTAFSVQLGHDAVDVVVTEGTVAVDPAVQSRLAAREPQAVATVEAGSRIVVELASASPPAAVRPVSEAELAQRLAWRVPKLEFSATPLAEAVPLINQYGRTTIEIGDAALGRVELSGVLRADNLETLLHLLTRDHGIRVERPAAERIVLYRGAERGR